MLGLLGVIAFNAAQLPQIDQLSIPKRPPNIAILASDGSLIANRGDSGGPAIRISDLPRYLPEAFVAIEDRRFYHHWGIDPLGVLRAVVSNLIGHRGLEGGSTLTQQLARNLFLTQERTFSRKIQEAILAVWLERRYSKRQILQLYLNRVYFGSGAYGVEAAAEKYFGHPARDVTLPEAAVLAGLMKAPTKLAPNRNPEGATRRAAEVIRAMTEEKYITPKMAKLALAHPARAVPESGTSAMNYAADFVMDALANTVGAIDQDVRVKTTLDVGLEAAGQRALIGVLDHSGARYHVSQGALVALDPDGAVKALIGGRNYSESQFNRAVSAHRQPGSTFKPFVYLAALERGLTPGTIRDDAPITFKGWSPEDAERHFLGPVTLTQALALSLNTVAVRLGLEVGLQNVASVARSLGILSPLQADASMVLGTSEVTPLELVSAYAPFANGGYKAPPHVIVEVRTASGKLLYRRKHGEMRQVAQPRYVAMMNAMLEQTVLTGTARRASIPGWQTAGKTGTTQDNRDAWFVGYTSRLVAGVWLGNDDSSPTKGVSGSNLPVAVWTNFMRFALKGAPPAPLPSQGWSEPLLAGPALQTPAEPRTAGIPQGTPDQEIDLSAEGVPLHDALAPQRPQPGESVGEAVRAPLNLLPPGDIPDPSERRRPLPRQKSLLEAIFGG